jgi:hypothetical protein
MAIFGLTLTLGGVLFTDFEVPQTIGEFGGTQRMAQHDFPGGIRTQRLYGAFPGPIRWSGLFTGTGALARSRVVDRLRVSGQEVTFEYGGTILLGVVTEFVAEPKHQWLVPYKIRFDPRQDLAANTPLDDFLSTFSLINDALSTLNNIISVIFSGSSGPTHAASDSSFTEVYFPLPPTLGPPLQSFVNLTFDQLQAALGIPQNIPFNSAQEIYAAAAAALAIAGPLSQSGDPTVSSPALDVISYVTTITSCIANPSASNTTTLYVTNPNLSRIAAQYYGDSTKWQIIADASGISPPDPLPIGQFTLVIPAVVH